MSCSASHRGSDRNNEHHRTPRLLTISRPVFLETATASNACLLRRGRAGQSGAVRSTPRSKAGKRVKRFHGREFVTRDPWRSLGGACRDGRRSSRVLLAAGLEGYERKGAFPACGAAPDGRYTRDAQCPYIAWRGARSPNLLAPDDQFHERLPIFLKRSRRSLMSFRNCRICSNCRCES